MGRGSSKAGGGSSSGGGASGGYSSIAATSAEQGFYDMEKATQKVIREKLDEAPVGTTIAMRYESSKNTTVYEKVSQDNFGKSTWMKSTVHGDGSVSTSYDRGTIIGDVQDMTRSKNIVKGLDSQKRKIYNEKGKPLIKSYRKV